MTKSSAMNFLETVFVARICRLGLSSLFLWAAWAVPDSSAAQGYSIVDLGVPNSGGNGSEAHGINQSGSVVGTWYQARHPYSQFAFSYANGTNTDLGTLDSSNGNSYEYAIALAVNNASQIVGQATTNSYNLYHAFLDTNGVMIDLDNTSQAWSSANAINQRGQIVGEFTTTVPLGLTHAFVYTNGGFGDLGTLPGGTYSSAKGINDAGVIVGESSDASGNVYAFVYSNGSMTNLGTLGGNYSSARAINNSGVIVGEASASNGETHAFIYSNSVMRDLGTFGGTNSSAAAISSSGQVVGYANDANQVVNAFVYSGSMLNLDAVSPPRGAFTNLAYAYGINDQGQICGGGVNTNGNYDAFLLTPPALSLTCSSNITVTASNLAGATVFFNLTATGGCSQPTVTAVPPSGSTFPVGTNTFNVTASDLCGHTNTCSFLVTVNPPNFPPIVVNCSSNVTVTATSSNGAVVTFGATASGGCSSPNVTANPPSGSTFPVGITTVTNTAADTCGNSTNCTFTVTVVSPPIVLTCPSNLTVIATSSNGAVVTFSANATGGCTAPSIVAVPPSGSLFPIGTIVVTNLAYDSCGNSANATFTITVRPPPTPLNLAASILTNAFTMTIAGATGQVFVVQTSSNLADWVPLFTNSLLGNSTNFTDASALTNDSRFYRTVTLPP